MKLIKVPKSLRQLQANCGPLAVWLVLDHYKIEVKLTTLLKACRHDPENGTFPIGLAVALKKFGFDVAFYGDKDPAPNELEIICYDDAEKLHLPIRPALSYQEIQKVFEDQKIVIVSYESLQGIGCMSVVYSMNEQEISFCEDLEPMSAAVFEQQRKVEGICQQVIVVGECNYLEFALKWAGK